MEIPAQNSRKMRDVAREVLIAKSGYRCCPQLTEDSLVFSPHLAYRLMSLISAVLFSSMMIAAAAPASDQLTMAQYNAVQTGMTYQEVVKIMGRPGEEVMRGDIVVYMWKNADGTNLNVTFRNNRVLNKAQAGLH
jgi:hypothetical protein